uniref:Uncharacterized protein n=1 Tax=Anguilla anguilla TaxID=7936 RepID=A0A0E9XU77_ANGAN
MNQLHKITSELIGLMKNIMKIRPRFFFLNVCFTHFVSLPDGGHFVERQSGSVPVHLANGLCSPFLHHKTTDRPKSTGHRSRVLEQKLAGSTPRPIDRYTPISHIIIQ